ncbi:diguanylate cyclase (GGDEF)-like protein [Natronospira proteinivora]|uniref:diguanylate cyclase n=1 Tax=Natronospira proteinivora TaxID=1807133 RepID=A0ABT1G8Y6_9GAMM|nr:GGDEF domain-containing protein [Natronospira proteinivora]MCP1727784.1 diguanylate cyclase (GGDEF)-like protein [Natronospira proteinivora]
MLTLILFREELLSAFGSFTSFQLVLVFALCLGILLLGFPSSRLGYVSFDRITQAGLIWLVGPVGSAVFNGLASLVFPFYIRKRTGQNRREALFRAMHNVGMIIFVIMAGGWAFSMSGGAYPVRSLEPGILLPVAATILAMQLANGFFVRVRYALTHARVAEPVDWFANTLEPAAALIGLLTVVIAVNTDQVTTLSYLFVLLALMFTVKWLSDSRQRLEEKVRERTAHIAAQNERLERAQARQQELVSALDRLSREDALTGLFNRRHIDDFLKQEKGRVDRYGGTLSVALLDLDHFKQINDQHSHQVGDEVLQEAARILQESARESDVIARYGGEEFLLVLSNTDLSGAQAVVERIRRAIAESPWEKIQAGVRLTVSGGVAELEVGGSLDKLLSLADQRLYEAKQAGRNRIIAA